MAQPQLPKGFDFTDPDVYAARLPTEELRELRRAAPIWWNEQPSGVGGFTDGGYWVFSRHRDVREVSRRDDVFFRAGALVGSWRDRGDLAAFDGDVNGATQAAVADVDDGCAAQNYALASHLLVVPVVEPAEKLVAVISLAASGSSIRCSTFRARSGIRRRRWRCERGRSGWRFRCRSPPSSSPSRRPDRFSAARSRG
jgi:hypothetical protein